MAVKLTERVVVGLALDIAICEMNKVIQEWESTNYPKRPPELQAILTRFKAERRAMKVYRTKYYRNKL